MESQEIGRATFTGVGSAKKSSLVETNSVSKPRMSAAVGKMGFRASNALASI
jgi:hypothetical protein